MTKATNAFGELGERIAARWLEQHGYTVLARRWRSGHRDIDLIAQRNEIIAFVEVKTRSGLEFGDPVEAVHPQKRMSLVRSARDWMARHEKPARVLRGKRPPGEEGTTDHSYRFDVIGVLLREGTVWVRHVKAAFTV